MIKPNLISFLERPITSDEEDISSLFISFCEAMHKKNPSLLKPLFAKDAVIEMISIPDSRLTLDEYLKNMELLVQRVRKLEYENVLIRVLANSASVYYTTKFFTNNSTLCKKHDRYIVCKKNEGRWLIKEMRSRK